MMGERWTKKKDIPLAQGAQPSLLGNNLSANGRTLAYVHGDEVTVVGPPERHLWHRLRFKDAATHPTLQKSTRSDSVSPRFRFRST